MSDLFKSDNYDKNLNSLIRVIKLKDTKKINEQYDETLKDLSQALKAFTSKAKDIAKFVIYTDLNNYVEQTFEFLKGVKGIHSKNEKKLRIFMEAVCGVAVSGVFCQKFTAIRGVYIGGLKSGVKRKFWQKYMQQNPDLKVAVIDGTIVRAHACST